jgi:hypothetical protein
VRLNWVVVRLTDGGSVVDLVDLTPAGPLKATIGRYETLTVTLPLSTAPGDWLQLTDPFKSAIIALDISDQDTGVPLWGGIITNRTRIGDASTGAITLALATAEAYLARRYISSTVMRTGTGQNEIAADLADLFVFDADGLPGRVENGTGGTARDRNYADADDRTVYSAFQDLMAVEDGLEFAVTWEWQDAPSRITPVLQLGTPQLGSEPLAGLSPAASFDLPGSVIRAEFVEDYSDGRGANRVLASSAVQGSIRPQSQVTADSLDGRPLVEFRYTPSTSISQVDTLTAHATRALALTKNGSKALTLTSHRAAAPKLGRDWHLGDTIGYQIEGPAFPGGISGVARCIGWELDELNDTVSPILAGQDIR